MERLLYLIEQYLQHNLNQEEEEELDQLIINNDEYMRIFEEAIKKAGR